MPLRINEKQYTHLRLKHYTMCKYAIFCIPTPVGNCNC